MRSSRRMDDATLRARAHAGMVAHTRLLAAHGGTLVEEDGWLACVLPHAPASSILNCVVGAPDVERIAQVYERHGVRKWGVWLDSADVEGARGLERAGLVLDSVPVVMGADLDEIELNDAPATHPVDLRTLGAINDSSYGYTDGRLEKAIAALPERAVDPHAVHDGGEPVAVTFILEVDDDACVCWVATLSRARRRGLASGVLRGALKAARQRGCTSTTLWASAMGAVVYSRLGYRTLGHVHLWESRP
jgi:GNAT superfamily N-acetyltransferase